MYSTVQCTYKLHVYKGGGGVGAGQPAHSQLVKTYLGVGLGGAYTQAPTRAALVPGIPRGQGGERGVMYEGDSLDQVRTGPAIVPP